MIELGKIFIIFGLLFDLIGAVSLLRMPDIYSRLQSASQSMFFGTVNILLGVFFCYGFSQCGFKAILAIGFLILSVPVCVHALARASHKMGVPLPADALCDYYRDDYDKKD